MTYRILEVRDRRTKKIKRFIAQRRLFWPLPWRDVASVRHVHQAYRALSDYFNEKHPRATHFYVQDNDPSLIRYE